MPPRNWKVRFRDMHEAVSKILSYCEGIRSEAEFSANTKTFDACIRNFQILGESSSKIPGEIQVERSEIPWREIKAMRNFLIHEYFGVSPSVVWSTIRKDLPTLRTTLEKAYQAYEQPVHPWRICPPGEIYVRKARVRTHSRSGSLVKEHLRQDHCRQVGSSGRNVLSLQECQDIEELFFASVDGPPAANDLGFGDKGTRFDRLIRGWTRYWNDVLKPEPALDADLVKALIASESSFDVNAGRKTRKSAKGLLQLMPQTIKYLNGQRKELRDHIFSFQGAEVYDPSLNISAGIRWLFRKRETASARLKRQASWEETVEEYKDYLHRRLKRPKVKAKGMETFRDYFSKLKTGGKK